MEIPVQFRKLSEFFLRLMPGLSEENWLVCENALSIRTIKKGELLLREGQICHHVSFINHGLLRMYYLVDGREKITEFFREENYCSDYRSFLLREPALVSIQAMEDTEVVDICYDDLQYLYKQIPQANIIGRLVAEELFIDVCKRTTAQANDDIARQYADLANEKPWLVQRVPQYMIASYLGITPEALSRIKSRASRKQSRPQTAY